MDIPPELCQINIHIEICYKLTFLCKLLLDFRWHAQITFGNVLVACPLIFDRIGSNMNRHYSVYTKDLYWDIMWNHCSQTLPHWLAAPPAQPICVSNTCQDGWKALPILCFKYLETRLFKDIKIPPENQSATQSGNQPLKLIRCC